MKSYILSVIGAVFLLDTVCIIIPSGKTGKMIEGIVKICSVIIMLTPLFNLFGGGGEFLSGADDYSPDSAYVEKSLCMQVESFYSENLKVDCMTETDGETIVVTLPRGIADEEFTKRAEALFGREIEYVFQGE